MKYLSSCNIALVLLPVAFIVLAIPTAYSYDTDFAYYATAAKMLANGGEMYVEVYDHKPPLYHHILVIGEKINQLFNFKILGYFIINFVILAGFYVACLSLLRNLVSAVRKSWNYQYPLMLFAFLTVCLTIQNFSYGNLNGGIVYLATMFELFSIVKIVKLINSDPTDPVSNKDILLLSLFTAVALLVRLHFATILPTLMFLIIFSVSTKNMVINWSKYVILTLLIAYAGTLLLTDNTSGFYEAVITDNISYVAMKNFKYPSYILTGYFSLKYCAFAFVFLLFSVLISIISDGSINSTINKLIALKSSKIFLILAAFTLSIFLGITLQKTGGKTYPFIEIVPILCIGCIILIAAISRPSNLKKLSLFSFFLSCIIYTSVLSYKVFLIPEASKNQSSFPSWKDNELVQILESRTSQGGLLFTANFNSWLYLLTDTLPVLKTQFLNPLVYRTNDQLDKELKAVFSKEPQFVTFTVWVKGGIGSVENYFTNNSLIFSEKYKYIGEYPTPYKPVRLWTKR